MNSKPAIAKDATRIIHHLREELKERFPTSHKAQRPTTQALTGVPALDALGLGEGMLVEIAREPARDRNPQGSNRQGATPLYGVAEGASRLGHYAALIDGADTFDPQWAGDIPCSRLLWVRCNNAAHALKSTDLLLRDGNLTRVLLDLQENTPRELDRIPGSTWFRLRNLAESSGALCLVFSPAPIVTGAHVRLTTETTFTIDTLDQENAALQSQLLFSLSRTRGLNRDKASKTA